MATQTARQTMGLAQPFILTESFEGVSKSVDNPLPTVMAGDGRVHHRLVQPFMVSIRSNHGERGVTEPLNTVVSAGTYQGIVQPFLTSYYSGSDQVSPVSDAMGTVTTSDRHALVQPSTISIEDCYFRMLQPSEIKRAMAFTDEYVVLGNKREQVKQCGNAVTPPIMEMLIRRCLESL
jgi:DNA (cytosine-5)-methyltransferase 1